MVDVKVRSVIAETLMVDVDRVTPGSSLIDDLEADSLDMVELVMNLEEKFNIEIPDDEAEKFKTVADVIGYMSKCNIAQA